MSSLKRQLKSEQGMYAIILVSVISFVFLIVSLNLSKYILGYTHFEILGKEKMLRQRAIREIQEHLFDPSACKNSFNGGSSISSQIVKDKSGKKIIFDLSKDSYKERGFKEAGLPKAKRMTILACDLESLKQGQEPPLACKTPLSVPDQSSFHHSSSVLKIDFQKYTLSDEKDMSNPDNFYPVYIPIYLKTRYKVSSKLSQFEVCSTFTPLLEDFYCSPMNFEFSCCRYVYEMELEPDKVSPKASKGEPFPAGEKVYTQTKSPGRHFRTIPTEEDPTGKLVHEDCKSSAKHAIMSAVCDFKEGWKIYTKCKK